MSGGVLVVDDDEGVRSALEAHLSPTFFVETAVNGAEAWRRLTDDDRDPPDAVVSDVMMPEVDGFRLLRRIRESNRIATVPVIVLTARGRESDVETALELGADDYVTKPFSGADVVDRVERCVDESVPALGT
jgi:DNA-binding response OmpR family regulator